MVGMQLGAAYGSAHLQEVLVELPPIRLRAHGATRAQTLGAMAWRAVSSRRWERQTAPFAVCRQEGHQRTVWRQSVSAVAQGVRRLGRREASRLEESPITAVMLGQIPRSVPRGLPAASGTPYAASALMMSEKPRRSFEVASTKPQTSTMDYDCLRCALILTNRDPETAPEHSHRCAFRDTGKDPSPDATRQHDA